MTVLVETAISIFIVIGAMFLFVGSFGLAKLPDTLRRLHAPTKSTTLGIGSLLVASMLFFVLLGGATGIHEVLITVFLFLTAPVTAMMIAKGHIFRKSEIRQALPPAPAGSRWASLADHADDKGGQAKR